MQALGHGKNKYIDHVFGQHNADTDPDAGPRQAQDHHRTRAHDLTHEPF